MMTTNMKDCFLEANEEEVRRAFRETMEGQIEHALYNKSFSNQHESDNGEFTLKQKIKWRMVFVDRGGSILDNDYEYGLGELFGLYRKAIDPEMQDFEKQLRVRHNIP